MPRKSAATNMKGKFRGARRMPAPVVTYQASAAYGHSSEFEKSGESDSGSNTFDKRGFIVVFEGETIYSQEGSTRRRPTASRNFGASVLKSVPEELSCPMPSFS
jgi:hypothetical protein